MKQSKKITKSANGQECQIRIPFICSRDNETTVFAHLGGAGMGLKKSSLHGSYACWVCHGAVDGAIKTEFSREQLELMHRQGVERTQNILLDKQLIILV